MRKPTSTFCENNILVRSALLRQIHPMIETALKAFTSHALDFAIAGMVGAFFAVCAWLWMASGESLVIATALAGLPTCF